MSVGVVTVAVGDTYRAFLPEWAQAVAALETQPDQVLIVTDVVTADVKTAMDTCGANVLNTATRWRRHPQILANEGISEMSTEWICKMDADDLIFPHALNPIADTTEDVLCFGIIYHGVTLTPPAMKAANVLAARNNLLFAGSPFRKTIWQSTSGFRDMVYDDWAFWRETARAGATYRPTGTADYEYRMHDHNASARINRQHEKQKALAT